jgi:tetratricopeptide (TPR) repeat protein
MEKSDFYEEDDDIRFFQEELPDQYAGIIKLIKGEYEDEKVQILKEDFPAIHDAVLKIIANEWDSEDARKFKEELPDFYDGILKILKRHDIYLIENNFYRKPYKKGDFIGQDYEVSDVLGIGGFGIVYLVYSHGMKEVFAMKTFRDEFFEDPLAKKRFKKEAEIWINLDRHPYIARAHFINEISSRLFIVMEYIAPDELGLNTLQDYLDQKPPNFAQSLHWSIQFCYGMEYAYAKGIKAHRDIKPSNILISRDETVKIADFGLAGVIGSSRLVSGIKLDIQQNKVGFSLQTIDGNGFGTPTHMPPEQFINAAGCDERSDIYSFGIVLYQMATGGKLPFLAQFPKDNSEEESIRFWQDMYTLHRKTPVPRIDSRLFPIIFRCLEKDPSYRYFTFKELRKDLEKLLKQQTGEVIKMPEQKELEAWELSNKGASLTVLKRYDEALICLDHALSINPQNALIQDAHIWYNKGTIYYELGNIDEALSCYDEALRINPHDISILLNLGSALHRLNRFKEAIGCYDRALKINPNYALAWANKGQSFERLGLNNEAIQSYDNALKINPRDARILANKGSNLVILKLFDEAITCSKEAIKINPNEAYAWLNKGLSEEKLGKRKDAIISFKNFLQLAPKEFSSLFNDIQRRLESLENNNISATKENEAIAWFEKGVGLGDQGHNQEAIQYFKKAVEIDPTYYEAWNNMGISFSKLDLQDEAIGCYDKALELNPLHTSIWHNKALSSRNLGKNDEAIRCFDKAIEIDPYNSIAWQYKGFVLYEINQHDEAIRCFEKVLETGSTDAIIFYLKALAHDALGQKDKSVFLFQRFLELTKEEYTHEIEYATNRLREIKK